MGRPTVYSDKTLEITQDYIENFESTYEDAIPSIVGLARVLKISRETVHDWARQESKPEFSDMLRILLSEQERTLINKGLCGKFNSNITKLVLTKHSYSDRQEVTGLDGGAIQTEDITSLDAARRMMYIISQAEQEAHTEH